MRSTDERMYLFVLLFVLSAYVPTTECACKTGFEILGEVLDKGEKQLKVFSSAHTCPACKSDFGCFNKFLDQLKMDMADLRTVESAIIDSYLNSGCSFNGKTLFVGPNTVEQRTQKVTSTETIHLPFSDIFGIDCDLGQNLLVYAQDDTFKIIKTDGDGTDAGGDFLGPGTRPKILDSDTFFINDGSIWRDTNGVSINVVTDPELSGFEIDPRGFIYFTKKLTNDVFRATLDGENIETLFTDTEFPTTLALESFTRRLYYTSTSEGNRQLKYFDLREGTSDSGVFITNLQSQVTDLAVCTSSIYLAYTGSPSGWEERNIDGTLTGQGSTYGDGNFVSLATCIL